MFRRLYLPALVLILLTPALAVACSCFAENTMCDQSWKSGEVIFLGKVTARTDPPPSDGPEWPKIRFTFSVIDSFRGPAIPGGDIVIYTGTGGGDCGYPFKVGTSYLVYAQTLKGNLTAGICTPTMPEVMAVAAVRQLRALQKGNRVDNLFGTIGTAPPSPGYEDLNATTPLAGIRVSVIGHRGAQRSTTTDHEGVYSFPSLPAGVYQVNIELPAGMTTWRRDQGVKMEVVIGPKSLTTCRMDEFARASTTRHRNSEP